MPFMERDDLEMSYRRGYERGAAETFDAVERFLDPRTREIIALAVSASNGCEYCVNSHTAALIKLGTDPETLGEIMAIIGLFNMTNSLADGYRIQPDVVPPL